MNSIPLCRLRLLLLLGFGLMGLLSPAVGAPAVASAAVSVDLVALGKPMQLTTTLDGPLHWSSSDPAVVVVVQGWVFGKAAGTASVTVQGASGVAVFTVKVAPGKVLVATPAELARLQGFITREGNRLMENGKPFRFISWNIPNLHIVEDPSWVQRPKNAGGRDPVYWHRVTPEEQADAVKTVAQMGGQVIRAYTLSVSGGRNNRIGPSHYTGPQAPLNEELMRDYDRMIALCGQQGIRLILPFIDEWDWFGGRKEFAALSKGGDFYTDRKVVDDFKALIKQVLERVNTITGIPYNEDPAIMAWETGNELQHVPAAWNAEIAAWIKQFAPRQLVADGATGNLATLDDPNFDLLTDHLYDHGGKDYVDRVLRGLARVGAKKPYYIGEFGCTDSDMEIGALDAVLQTEATGALLWSLRFHSAEGGFYWHNEGGQNSAYHWPGFTSNARSDEIRLLGLMRERIWAMRGYLPPPLEKPGVPELLATSTPAAISWWGSTGAEHYVLERSLDGLHWSPVAADLSDAGDPFVPYADSAAPIGVPVRYRLKAVNQAGESPWSAVLTCQPANKAGFIPGNDPRVAVMGRTEWDGSAMQMGFPGVVLRLCYRGPAPTLRLNASTADCYFNLSCNGWDPVVVRLKAGANAITPPTGVAPAQGWLLELVRRTEAFQGTVGFAGVELPEGCELLPPPAWPARKLLFIGDSTTTGEYIHRVPPEYDATARSFDASRSYAAVLGRRLQAQTHLVAYGGQGLIRDWAGKPTKILLPLIYLRALPDKEDSKWDPQRYQADVVIVNVGTDSDRGMPPDAELTDAYAGLVKRIRLDHPSAGIVICQNSHQHEGSPEKAQLLRVLEEVRSRQARAGDQRVFIALCHFYPGTANDGHIVAFQQEQLAEEILPVIRQAAGW